MLWKMLKPFRRRIGAQCIPSACNANFQQNGHLVSGGFSLILWRRISFSIKSVLYVFSNEAINDGLEGLVLEERNLVWIILDLILGQAVELPFVHRNLLSKSERKEFIGGAIILGEPPLGIGSGQFNRGKDLTHIRL